MVQLDMFHINRLKLTFVSTQSSTVITEQQLNKAIQGKNVTRSITYTASNILVYSYSNMKYRKVIYGGFT